MRPPMVMSDRIIVKGTGVVAMQVRNVGVLVGLSSIGHGYVDRHFNMSKRAFSGV